jgi:hypothetical protein
MLAAAVAIAVVAALTFPMRPALGAGPTIIPDRQEFTMSASSGGGTNLCIDDVKSISAGLRIRTWYHLDTDPAGTQREVLTFPSGHTIKATDLNPGIGALSPSSGVVAGPSGSANFTFTAQQLGATTIELRDTSDPRFQPISIPIQVVDCYYELTIVSRWQIPSGWFETMSSRIDRAELRRDQTTGLYRNFAAVVHNGAVGRPQGGCTPAIATPDSTAIVTGTITGNGRTLELSATYHAVSVTTTSTCRSGGKTLVVTDHASGIPGVLKANLQARGDTKTRPHRVTARKNVTGTANIVLVKIVP